MKRFIVTGGYGFIGSNLIRLLIKKKYKVLNIDNMSYSAQNYNLIGINKKNYSFEKVDINNRKEILRIFKSFKPEGIFNLAADTHVDRSIDNSFNFIKNNILGVYNLLEALKIQKKKIRLVHISTDEVYGDVMGKKDLMKIIHTCLVLPTLLLKLHLIIWFTRMLELIKLML